jgi:RNA 2',3'-cyclic 3'-phosphodiesterase
MRLFIAFSVTEEIKSYLLSLKDNVPKDIAKIRWVSQIHLTLKFLGEVPENKIPLIKEHLSKVRFEEFKIELSPVGFFPNENYIRVIWVGLTPQDRIIELQKKVDFSLSSLFDKEKDFMPHITLGRVSFIREKEKFVKLLKGIEIKKLSCTVNSFRLIQSTLTPEGPVYQELEEYRCQ